MTLDKELQHIHYEMATQDVKFQSTNILMEGLSCLEPFVVMLLEVNIMWMTNNPLSFFAVVVWRSSFFSVAIVGVDCTAARVRHVD